jgi:hypothetical protein
MNIDPCPFCGGPATLDQHVRRYDCKVVGWAHHMVARCMSEGCEAEIAWPHEYEGELLASDLLAVAWSRRAK